MRRFLLLLGFCTLCGTLGLTSCSPKVGCPANEAAHVQPNRKGELPTTGGSSQLFPKKFNKKKKRKRNKN